MTEYHEICSRRANECCKLRAEVKHGVEDTFKMWYVSY